MQVYSEEFYNEDELYHHGVKGMHWGIRKERNKNYQKHARKEEQLKIIHGNAVKMEQQKKSSFAKMLSAISPKLAEKQDEYKSYTIRDKNGNNIGNISTNDEGDDVNIVWLQIKDAYGGNGYAQDALNSIIQDSKDRGFKTMSLEVPGTSPNARHIYEKYGFVAKDELIGDLDDVWGGLTPMTLDLSSVKSKTTTANKTSKHKNAYDRFKEAQKLDPNLKTYDQIYNDPTTKSVRDSYKKKYGDDESYMEDTEYYNDLEKAYYNARNIK